MAGWRNSALPSTGTGFALEGLLRKSSSRGECLGVRWLSRRFAATEANRSPRHLPSIALSRRQCDRLVVPGLTPGENLPRTALFGTGPGCRGLRADQPGAEAVTIATGQNVGVKKAATPCPGGGGQNYQHTTGESVRQDGCPDEGDKSRTPGSSPGVMHRTTAQPASQPDGQHQTDRYRIPVALCPRNMRCGTPSKFAYLPHA